MIQVMIVEDQKLIRSLLESYIEKEEGYQVAASLTGANRAPDLCDGGPFDLILMDVQTEHRENGLTAVEKIKQAHPSIKIVDVLQRHRPDLGHRGDHGEIPCDQYAPKDQSEEQAPAGVGRQ